MPGQRPNVRRVMRRPRRPLGKDIREYTLDSQNPGKRRNYTVRDSQTYVEPTLFQMSGVWRIGTESSNNRIAGFGVAGT